jgi:hypothetical protein
VRQTRAEFRPSNPKGLGDSNPPLSATQSAIFVFSEGKSKILRMLAQFVRLEGTREAQIRPSVADLCSILSVENRAGALSARLWQTGEPPMEMRINRAVDPPFIEGVCGELLALGKSVIRHTHVRELTIHALNALMNSREKLVKNG